MSRFAQLLLTALSHLPLRWLQGIGAWLGRLIFLASPRFAARLSENLTNSKISENYQVYQQLVKQCAKETGKGSVELAIAWCRPSDDIVSMVQSCHGWEAVEAAIEQQQGLLFITPHLGSYDIAGRYISSRLPFPLTAMFRPPKLKWLEPIMQKGRVRDKGRTAPANASGVRAIMKALKDREATIILPDQTPGNGEGVWAPFFGRPAYTMTLATRLAQMKNVTSFLFVGERLPKGQGFSVHIEPLGFTPSGDKVQDVTLLNQAIEALIRRYPSQYLWSYNRYKRPSGAPSPDEQITES